MPPTPVRAAHCYFQHWRSCIAWFLLVSRGKKSEALFLLRACWGRTRRLALHRAEMLRDAEMLGGITNDSCDSYHAKRGQVRARPKKPATTHLGESRDAGPAFLVVHC